MGAGDGEEKEGKVIGSGGCGSYRGREKKGGGGGRRKKKRKKEAR